MQKESLSVFYCPSNACIRRATVCSRKAVGVMPTIASNLREKCGRVLKPHCAAISVTGNLVKRSYLLATVMRWCQR